MHLHDTTGGLTFVVAALAVIAVTVYLVGALSQGRRGRAPWPPALTAAWIGAVATVVAATVGPIGRAAHEDLVAHMTSHLMLGMLAPLLLVLSAPVTLALRTLDVVPARRLSRLLKSRPI